MIAALQSRLMNVPRALLAGFVTWLISVPLGYVVNTYLFASLMSANASALRPEADLMARLPMGFAASLLAFLAFAYVYAKGYEGGSAVAEGARFGALAGVIVVGMGIAWVYVSYPVTLGYGIALMADTLVETTLFGVIVGLIYKPR